jgi:SMODS-associated and fused to various effectors sensor domain
VSDPIQIVYVLDVASDNPIRIDDFKHLLPDKREERIVFKLSDFGVSPAPRGRPGDWAGCAEALSRMVARARVHGLPDGPPVHHYVAGRAALPIFAQLGLELSKWAEITAINQRHDGTWDALPLRASAGAAFFDDVRGLRVEEPSEADGRVAVYVSTGRAAPREAIHAFVHAQGDRLAGLVEVRPRGEGTAVLDASRAPAAAAELAEVFAALPRAYPRLSGLALFLDGPTTLALMAGRAVNPSILSDVWVPVFEGGAYLPTVTLPWKTVAAPPIGDSPGDELDRTRLLHAIVDEIEALKARLTVEHLPPPLAPGERQAFVDRVKSIEVSRDPGEDAFDLSVTTRRLSFGRGLLEGLRRAPEALRVKVGLTVFLHELFHFDQHLHSTTYRGIGRAGFVLEEVDYWADAFAAYTLAKLAITRGGDEARERAREIVTSWVDVGLAGIEAFDRFEHGDRIARLHERRLRRYLVWHLQRARAEALDGEDQLWELFGRRPVVELSLLECDPDLRARTRSACSRVVPL